MKIVLQISILVIMLFFSGRVSSQKDSLKIQQDSLKFGWDNQSPDTWLYRWSGYRFAQQESSIGIVPSIQGVNELYLGIGISKARFRQGEGGGTGYGTTICVDFNPIDKIIAPKINLWATGYVFILGGSVGIGGFYYIKDKESNFVLRPEIGIGYLKIYINYGYNMFLRNDFGGVSQHTFTFSYYHTFLPFKKKKKST